MTARRVLAALTGAALAATVLTVAGAPAQAADTVTALGLTSFSQMAVDDAHQEVFLVGGQDVVEVRGFDGSLKGTVTGQTGASSVAVAPGGAAVYVALQGAGAVSRVDAVTLAETARYPLAGVRSVAFAGSRLFASYSTGTVGAARVTEIDLTAVPPAATAPFGTPWYSPPLLSGDGTGEHLVAVWDGVSPGTVTSYDLAQTPPTGTTVNSVTAPGSNCDDVAVEATGGDAVVACGAPYVHNAYRTSDLGLSFTYPTTNYPNAAATSASGVALGVFGWYSADIFMFARHSSTVARTMEVDPTGGTTWTLAPRGLALSADGTRLFAVSTSGTALRFHVYADPFTAPPGTPTLTVSAPATAPRGVPLTLTGSLTGTPALPAGTVLTVSRTDLAGTHALPGTTTDAAGAFTVTDTPPVGGPTTYTVSFAGDARHLATTAGATVAVARATPVLTVTTNAAAYAYGGRVTVTAHLGPTFNGRAVKIYARPYGQATVLIASGTVNSLGNLTVTRVVSRRTTFSAAFAGDYRYAPRTVSRTVTVGAAVAETLSGSYGRSGSYALFRTTVNPVLTTRVTPNKAGQCVRFVAQRYSAGAWRAWASSACAISLDANSLAAADLRGSHPRGVNFRMRVEYVGDTANAATNGVWKYFRFP